MPPMRQCQREFGIQAIPQDLGYQQPASVLDELNGSARAGKQPKSAAEQPTASFFPKDTV